MSCGSPPLMLTERKFLPATRGTKVNSTSVPSATSFISNLPSRSAIFCGSPSTVSCYVMAKNMGHDGTLTSSTVMLTTFFSAFTLTLWLFILKSFHFL